MTTLILVRHGENDWVKKQRLAGWIPGVHLNENGRQQARDAAQRLAAVPIKAIYSSPVERCMETAVSISDLHKIDVIPLAEVGEVRYGDWEGKKIKKLARHPLWRIVQFFPSRLQFPNGEALREVQFRAVQAVETISKQHNDEVVVVVSHADLIKLLLAHYLGVHIDLFQRIIVSPASVSILSLPNNGMVRVVRINDDGPLHFPPTTETKPKAELKKKRTKKSKKIKIKNKNN
jgi:probable phosphomutase (TIGR03848 family)